MQERDAEDGAEVMEQDGSIRNEVVEEAMEDDEE